MEGLIHYWFSFAGRIQRTHFLIGIVFSALILFWTYCGSPLPHFLWVAIPSALALALRYVLHATARVVGAVAFTSFHVRRLHDRNLSGWWTLLASLWYICGGFFVARFHCAAPIAVVTLLPIPAWILSLIPGSQGENHYGDEPKA